jgi:hypothetical protein
MSKMKVSKNFKILKEELQTYKEVTKKFNKRT